jgi:hypothetical protein
MVDTSSSLVEKLYCVLPNRSIPSWQAIAQYANPHGLISSLGSYGWTTYRNLEDESAAGLKN